jgi:hypothetical protein
MNDLLLLLLHWCVRCCIKLGTSAAVSVCSAVLLLPPPAAARARSRRLVACCCRVLLPAPSTTALPTTPAAARCSCCNMCVADCDSRSLAGWVCGVLLFVCRGGGQ